MIIALITILFLQFNLLYCFLGLILKWLIVWDKVFWITVALTDTNSLFSMGLPMSVKSLPPTNNTFSNFNSSPGWGGQWPWMVITSLSVTLNCVPHKYMTANKRPTELVAICLLISLITSKKKKKAIKLSK